MKTLIIMRHGKSSWSHIGLNDFDRNLDERGRKNSAEMAQFILQKSGVPELILASASKRTVETATIVAENMGYAKENIQTDAALYLACNRRILDKEL